jgi:hypothetical protein
MEKQDSNFKKPHRVVTLIKRYPQPKEIFEGITQSELPYTKESVPEKPIRDRAIMAFYFASAGRGAEVCGGRRYTRGVVAEKDLEGNSLCVICGKVLAPGAQRKFCCKEHRNQIIAHPLQSRHTGLLAEAVSFDKNRIFVNEMEVAKRSPETIKKYGPQAINRPPYAIPLVEGLFDNPFWDQLVPFGWLIMEYLTKYAPTEGKLFDIENSAAYKIVHEVTGNYLNWFRAMGKHFYGYFLLTDTVKLTRFVNDKDPKSELPYVGYDWTEQLKDKSMAMDFDWIGPAADQIKERLKFTKKGRVND